MQCFTFLSFDNISKHLRKDHLKNFAGQGNIYAGNKLISYKGIQETCENANIS